MVAKQQANAPLQGMLPAGTRFDFYASFVAALVAVLVGGMIWADVSLLDFSRQDASVRGAPVATIKLSRNVVRKKTGALPIWNLAAVDEPLFEDDYVFTDRDSSVKVKFLDHDEIELNQNTMIQVQRFQNEASLGLLKGTLRVEGAKATKPLVIKLGKQGAILRADAGSRLNVRADANGQTSVAVLSGKAEVLNSEKQIVLEAAQSVTTSPSGAIEQAADVGVILDEPRDGARFVLGAADRLVFTWVRASTSQPAWFELARDAAFHDAVVSDETTSDHQTMTDLEPGTYYWRVRTSAASEVRTLMITRRLPPQLLWPEDGLVIAKDQTSLMLVWKDAGLDRNYLVEMAPTPAFDADVWREQSRMATQATPLLAPGVYYWRVRDADQQSGEWSAVGRFTIGKTQGEAAPEETPQEEEALPPPDLNDQYEIVVPGKKEGAFLWERLLGIGAAYAAGEEVPVIRWPEIKAASAYAIQIAPNEGFTTVLREEDVLAPLFSFEGFEPGVYFLRIATRNAKGVKGAYSKPVKVVVSHPAPRLVAPVNDATLEHGVAISFDWRRVEGAKSYRVEIARDPAFKAVVRTETPPLSAVEVKGAEAGTYYWRVSAVSKNGHNGPPSQTGRFTVAQPPAPPPSAAPVPPPAVATQEQPAPPAETAMSAAVASEPMAASSRWHVALGAAPTQFNYDGGNRAPDIKLDARLYNSFFFNTAAAMGERWRAEAFVRRLATELFSPNERVPVGQQPLKVATVTAGLAAVLQPWTSGGAHPSWIGVKAGLMRKTLLRFSEDAAGLVSVKHAAILEPLVGLNGEWAFATRWRLALAIDGMLVTKNAAADVTRGSHVSGEMALVQAFPSSPFFAQYGYRMERARYVLTSAAGGGNLTNEGRSALFGLGFQF